MIETWEYPVAHGHYVVNDTHCSELHDFAQVRRSRASALKRTKSCRTLRELIKGLRLLINIVLSVLPINPITSTLKLFYSIKRFIKQVSVEYSFRKPP